MELQILGHDWAVKLLQQHIASGETRHAYLFSGPPGVGRRTLALRFAQALNCLQPPAPGVPCGTCRTCQQIGRLQQPDLSIVQGEDGGVLKVEQVRELQHSLSLTPYDARYRVALLLNFQSANPSAQNALLKTLEEAPERAILLLTTDTPESLLPTITSRCETLRLRPLPVGELAHALTERWSLPEDEAVLLAHLSGGRVGYALSLHESPELLEQRQGWLEDLHMLLVASRRERFAYAESVTKRRDRAVTRENLRSMFGAWLSYWRDLLLTCSGSSAPLINRDWAESLRDLSRQIGPSTARACAANLEQAITRLDANLNFQLLTEVVLLDWPRIR